MATSSDELYTLCMRAYPGHDQDQDEPGLYQWRQKLLYMTYRPECFPGEKKENII